MEKKDLLEAMKTVGIVKGMQVYHVDEMRIGLWGQVRRVWALRGIPVVQPVQIVFAWKYLLLGVNTQTGNLIWDWIERIRQEQLLPVLRRWSVDAIVWDNASSHKGKQIAALDHRLVFLPTYSPELNPAERIFRELRREIEGHPYPSLYAKQQYVEHLLRQLAADRQRVKRLTNWWWIQDAFGGLPVA